MSGVIEHKVCTAETPNDFAPGAIWAHPHLELTSRRLENGVTIIWGACPHCGLGLPELEIDDTEYESDDGNDGGVHDWMQP